VRVLSTDTEIRSIRPIWEKCQWSPYADIDLFLSQEIHNGIHEKPYVFLIEESGKLTTIVVGKCAETRLPIRFGYRRLSGPKLKVLMIPSSGVFVDESKMVSNALAEKIIRMMKKGDIDVFRINAISMSSNLFQSIIDRTAFYMRGAFPITQTKWMLSTNGKYEDFLKKHKNYKKTKKYFKNKLNNSYADKVSIKKILTADESVQSESFMADIEAVALKSWQHRIGENKFTKSLVEDKIRHYQSKNQLRAYILMIDGEPVAYWYGMICKKTLFLDQTAFDPRYRKYSPGTLLLMEIIDDSFGDPNIDALDFGFGNDQGKVLYCDLKTKVATLFIYAPRLNPLLGNFAKSSIEMIHQFSKYVFEKFKLVGEWKKTKRLNASHPN
jgi:hypothetical protein